MYLLLDLTIIFEKNVKADIGVVVGSISVVISSVVSISVKEVEVEEVDIKEFKDSNNFW